MHGSKAGYAGVSKSSVAHGFGGGDGVGVGDTTHSLQIRGIQTECAVRPRQKHRFPLGAGGVSLPRHVKSCPFWLCTSVHTVHGRCGDGPSACVAGYRHEAVHRVHGAVGYGMSRRCSARRHVLSARRSRWSGSSHEQSCTPPPPCTYPYPCSDGDNYSSPIRPCFRTSTRKRASSNGQFGRPWANT
jgi:hypothetical protein